MIERIQGQRLEVKGSLINGREASNGRASKTTPAYPRINWSLLICSWSIFIYSSTVTYTSVYTDSKPWRFQWVSDEDPKAPAEAPPSLHYVPGPEHPPLPNYVPDPEEPEHAPLSQDYVPEPEYPEYWHNLMIGEIPSPPLLLPSTTHKDDLPEADMPLRKRARFTTLAYGFKVGESSAVAAARKPGSDVATMDATPRRPMSRENFFRDRRYHLRTLVLVESEARCARQALGQAIDFNKAVTYSSLQTQLTTTLGHIQTLEAREPARTDDPEDAGSSFMIRELVAEGQNELLWFENMESVFHISNCIVACQIKFATCTLQGNALTWWNSHVRTVRHDVAYVMTWKTLKKMMTDKYCLRGEIKKLEIELCNLKVKGTDVESYSQHFRELALMCSRMFSEESNEVEKYVSGLLDMIQGSMTTSNPKKMQDEIEFATELMDQNIRTLAERQAKNKRKFKDTSRNNQNQQQPSKRHNMARAYTVGPGERNCSGRIKHLCALNETNTMMGSVLPSVPTARGLAISPGNVEASLLLPTTREPKGKSKSSHLL
ncbi:reverse transcriptase domain-containing protein [Tanacetum coccineum]